MRRLTRHGVSLSSRESMNCVVQSSLTHPKNLLHLPLIARVALRINLRNCDDCQVMTLSSLTGISEAVTLGSRSSRFHPLTIRRGAASC
jgi:hypothetical protein